MAPAAPLPADEDARLATLGEYPLLDTGPDPAFDALTALAAAICGTPISLVSLVDRSRQWFKSHHGLEVAETPRRDAFCAHTILGREVFVVEDAPADPRFVDNGLVVGEPHIRFYAGAPLVSPEGHALGTLCVIDRRPRRLDAAQLAALRTLAQQVMSQLELQRRNRQLARTLEQRNADLAALRMLQEQLAERDRRMQRLTAQLPGVVYQFRATPDGRGAFTYASEGLRRLFGVGPEEVADDAKLAYARVHPDDVARVMATTAESARTLAPWDCEYRVVDADGGVRWLHGRSVPERQPDGGTQWHGFLTDVTERHRTDDALRESEAVLRQAQHLAHLGSWRWNSATGDSRWSDETYRLFGVDPATFRATFDAFLALVHPDDRDAVARAHADALSGLRPYDIEYRVVTPAGELRHLHGRAEVVPDAARGGAPTMIGTVLEISERKRAEQALARHRDDLERLVVERTAELVAARDAAQQASRAKSDFLSAMSHELRTPMNAILGFGQLLELEAGLGPRARGFVGEILRAGRHLLQLIDEVLDLARVEAGRPSLSSEAVALEPLLLDARALVLPAAQARGVDVAIAPLGGLAVRADRLRLKQVLLNLLSNAVKYNRDGGRVEVEAAAVDVATVRIAVRDSGIGIAADEIPRLFKPFSRLAASAATVEGTGIGLALSERLVALMGGRIGVDSRLGEGSTFWVELPAGAAADGAAAAAADNASASGDAPAPGDDPAAAAAPVCAGGSPRARVLYVEDNPANVLLVQQIVARHPGVALLTASGGRVGLEMARAHRPDLVLLDLHLPDVDGYAVLAALRADPRLAATPVVAVTAQAMADDLRQVREAGFDDHATKPIDVARFDAMLGRLLPPRRAR